MQSWTVQWVVSSIINAADGLEKGQVCPCLFGSSFMRGRRKRHPRRTFARTRFLYHFPYCIGEKNTASTVENPVQGSESDETKDKGGIYECNRELIPWLA